MIRRPHSSHLLNVIIHVRAHCWTYGRRPCMHDMSIGRFFAEIAMSSLNNASVTRPPDILTHLNLNSLPIKNRPDNRRPPARCAPNGIALPFLDLILPKAKCTMCAGGTLIRKDRGFHLIIMLHFSKRIHQFTGSPALQTVVLDGSSELGEELHKYYGLSVQHCCCLNSEFG